MSDAGQKQSPEEIERRIEQTRQHMSQTLEALQQKLAPGDLMEEAWGYIRGSSADVGKSLVQTMRDNPVPVLLIGVGVSWMVMSSGSSSRQLGYRSEAYDSAEGREYGTDLGYESAGYMKGDTDRSSSRAGLAERAKHKWHDAKETISDATAKVKGSASDMADRISDRTQDKTNRMGEQAHEMTNRMSEKAHEVTDRVSGKAQEVAGRVSESAHEIGDRAREMSHQAGEKYHELADRSQELYQNSRDRAAQMGRSVKTQYQQQRQRASQSVHSLVEEHPLAVIAIGLGIGAFLGAVLPSSRREDRLLGETREHLRDGLMEAGRDQIERARDMAERAAQVAREKVEEVRAHGSEDQSASARAGTARQDYKTDKKEDRVAATPSTEARKPVTPPL